MFWGQRGGLMKKLLGTAAALAFSPALAAPPSLRAPVPAAPIQQWITAADIPADTLRNATVIGPASFALTISEKGRVTGCAVERTSGWDPLDKTACYIFELRGRFQPALDARGKAAIGVYRVEALWAMSGQTVPTAPMVEMAVALQKMPQPLSDPAYVEIAVSVDETGKVDGCAPAEALSWAGEPIPDRQQAASVLGGIPCAEALKTLKLQPAKTDKGKPVRSVQTATVLFTANVPALVASAAPQAETQGAHAPAVAAPQSPAAPPAEPGDREAILVEGRNIKGTITRPEAAMPPIKGNNPIVDFEVVGNEAVLLLASTGQWFRATLQPPCIGNSNMVPTDIQNPPGIAVVQHPDGSVDYRSVVLVTGEGLPAVTVPGEPGRCQMLSLVESAPPKGWKKSSRPVKPAPPALAPRPPATAPDGGPVYPVQWQERPTEAMFKRIAAGWSGSGWIMCQTAADYKVRNCRTVSEAPTMTGVANRMKLEASNFRVKPPMVEGRPAIGTWVAIGFDFTAKRKEPVTCYPNDPRDPC